MRVSLLGMYNNYRRKTHPSKLVPSHVTSKCIVLSFVVVVAQRDRRRSEGDSGRFRLRRSVPSLGERCPRRRGESRGREGSGSRSLQEHVQECLGVEGFVFKRHEKDAANLARHRPGARIDVLVQLQQPRAHAGLKLQDRHETRPVLVVLGDFGVRLGNG